MRPCSKNRQNDFITFISTMHCELQERLYRTESSRGTLLIKVSLNSPSLRCLTVWFGFVNMNRQPEVAGSSDSSHHKIHPGGVSLTIMRDCTELTLKLDAFHEC